MMLTIETETNYKQVMVAIETYLAKGAASMSRLDLAELQRLSLLVERYDEVRYPIPYSSPLPKTA